MKDTVVFISAYRKKNNETIVKKNIRYIEKSYIEGVVEKQIIECNKKLEQILDKK